MDGSSDDGSTPDTLLAQVADVKRHTTPTACQQCRQKKQRCDGQRPCAGCIRRRCACTYTSNVNETPRQATKRKFGQLEQLMNSLKSDEEGQAANLLQRLRAGESYESILDRSRYSSTQTPEATTSRLSHARHAFLICLSQSTLSLHEINRLIAAAFDTDTAINLPSPDRYVSLSSSIIDQNVVHSLLEEANPDREIEEPADTRRADCSNIVDGTYRGPSHWLPATPWVRSAITSDAVSHLVSLFLSWFNPYWRYVEEDLFIAAMRSQSHSSEYCSSFLVAAIMALAAQHSELDDAYETFGNRLSRGEQSHEEALRLWRAEGDKPSLTNIQALLILSHDACLRGRDRVGLNLMSAAVSLHQRLKMPADDESPDPAKKNYNRSRRTTAAAVAHIQASFAMHLWRDYGPVAPLLQEQLALERVLPDTRVGWTGFPQVLQPTTFRQNLMVRERCKLTVFMIEVNRLLLMKTSVKGDLETGIHELGASICAWYDNLPGELALVNSAPAPLYDFHLQANAIIIALYKEGIDELFGINADSPNHLTPSQYRSWAELHRRGLQSVYRAVSIIRSFRETYGLKIGNAAWHTATTCAFALLRELRISPSSPVLLAPVTPPRPPTDAAAAAAVALHPIRDVHVALEECFRCLIASGLQITLPRAIARMAALTAAHTGVLLPSAVRQLLESIGDLAWKPEDLHKLSSGYPNWAIPRTGAVIGEDNRMDDLLMKWERWDVEQRAAMAGGGRVDSTSE